MISETKIDSSFLSTEFHLESYATQNILDRNANSGGKLLYISSMLVISDLSIERLK